MPDWVIQEAVHKAILEWLNSYTASGNPSKDLESLVVKAIIELLNKDI